MRALTEPVDTVWHALTNDQRDPADPPEVLRQVATPQYLQRPVRLVVLLGILSIIGLIIVPWVQTAAGEGRVVAWSPQERPLKLEAPVEGRVGKWLVQEGEAVKKGQVLAELRDNDPDVVARLEAEREAVATRLAAATERKKRLEDRQVALEASRTAAIGAATKRLAMAGDRITVAKRAADAAAAAAKTARWQADRQRALVAQGLVSQRQAELADLDATRSVAEVDRAKAQLALSRSEQAAVDADRLKVEADTTALIQDLLAQQSAADSEIASATAEIQRMGNRLARQQNLTIVAPKDGIVLQILVREGIDMVKSGDALAVLVPATTERAVEVWIDGRDAPLVRKGALVRMQLEGWPALQFSGWPELAVGTFEGQVAFVDAADNGKGYFRVLVQPVPGARWPDRELLRQGVRAQAWFQLGQVRLGYELWRQFNGFPPMLTPLE
jgi:multidrug resistance efflux pump